MKKLTSDHMCILTLVFLGLTVIAGITGMMSHGNGDLAFNLTFGFFIFSMIGGFASATAMSIMDDQR